MSENLDRIEKIRNLLKKKKFDGYILSTFDEYLNEYVPDYNQRLRWLTGFTGSSGLVLLIDDRCLFFTDGRYLVQAKKEISDLFEIIDSSTQNIFDWLLKNVPEEKHICVDQNINSISFIQKLEKVAKKNRISMGFSKKILIDNIRNVQGYSNKNKAYLLPNKLSGKNSKVKIQNLKMKIKNIDYFIITDPHSVNWLLNIRGNDLQYTPIVLCRMIITSFNRHYLFIDENKLDKKILEYFKSLNIEVFDEKNIFEKIRHFSSKSKVMIDENATYIFYNLLKKNKITPLTSRQECSLDKSKKNKIEIKNAVLTHNIDALALIKFIYWLESCANSKNLNEYILLKKLEEYRRQNKIYVSPSFSTISAAGKNGAIIHYSPSKTKSRNLVNGDIYLCDSGGQYITGTTDVTRTFFFGNMKPNKVIKSFYTKVLKGHVSLSMIKFTRNTKGVQLDSIARRYLRKIGLDYNHGTGHGVGNFLNVHEGPQSISKYLANVSLEEGMILSIEPGLYLENKFGIRIENLVYVTKSEYKGFFEFETLTMVPYEKDLINKSELEIDQINWINNYHKKIFKVLSPLLNKTEKRWLKNKTLPI